MWYTEKVMKLIEFQNSDLWRGYCKSLTALDTSYDRGLSLRSFDSVYNR